jgi:hypothetical protein
MNTSLEYIFLFVGVRPLTRQDDDRKSMEEPRDGVNEKQEHERRYSR